MASRDVGEPRFVVRMSCLHRVPFESTSLPHGHEVNIHTTPYTLRGPCQQCDRRKQLARFNVVKKMTDHVNGIQTALRSVVDMTLQAWTTPGTRSHVFIVLRTLYRDISATLAVSVRILTRHLTTWVKGYHRFRGRWYVRPDLQPDLQDDFGLFGSGMISPPGMGSHGGGGDELGVEGGQW